jgi:hypothetical protein
MNTCCCAGDSDKKGFNLLSVTMLRLLGKVS